MLNTHLLRNVRVVDVLLDYEFNDSDEVITACGDLLELDNSLIRSLFSRHNRIGSSVGDEFAIVHIDKDMRDKINNNKIVFIRLANSIPWDNSMVKCVVGVCSTNKDHSEVMAGIARVLLNSHNRAFLKMSKDKEEIVEMFL